MTKETRGRPKVAKKKKKTNECVYRNKEEKTKDVKSMKTLGINIKSHFYNFMVELGYKQAEDEGLL